MRHHDPQKEHEVHRLLNGSGKQPAFNCGVDRLRVADASVMPAVTAGNTNAPSIMIGEKAAEMLAADHGVQLKEFVAG